MSQKTLAERTQQKHQSVARHEIGENQMTVAQLEAYAAVLRIKPEELLNNSLRVNPKLRGLLDLFEQLPEDEQERFVRMGYAFAEPNVRYLAQTEPKPPAERPAERPSDRRPNRRARR